MPQGNDITTRFKVDVSDLKRGITEANNNIKHANAQFKAATSGMDMWTKSADGIRAKLNQLASVLTEQTNKLRSYESQLEKTENAQQENARRAEELRAKLRQLAESGVSTTSEEYKKYEKALTEVEKEQAANERSADALRTTILNQQGAVSSIERDIRRWSDSLETVESEQAQSESATGKLTEKISKQQQELDKLKRKYKDIVLEQGEGSDAAEELAREIEELSRELRTNQQRLESAEDAADEYDETLEDIESSSRDVDSATASMSDGFTVMKGALANLVADGIRKGIDALKEFATSTVEAGIAFDSSMSQVGAVSGATAQDLQKLEKKAKELGESTKFSASEAADAFNYMAMAGWKTEDMLEGIDGILDLAASSGTDLATTSDIVTDALTAMGYKAKDAGRLADVMAAASSNANTNVEMMGATFQYAAPLVGALGYNMEDTAVAIGLMANSGIKGEKAGTALRSILTRLASPPKAAATAMEELGLSITDSSGKMKPFNEVMEDMRKAFSKLDETEQAEMASKLAGQEAMSGLLSIVNAAPSDFAKLTEAVKDSEGAAKKMADTMMDNLGGDMTTFQSQMEGVKLKIYNALVPALRDAISAISNFVDTVDWDDFGKKVGNALTKVIDALKWLITNKNMVVSAMTGMIAAFAVAKIGSFVTGLVGMVKAFQAARIATEAATTAQVANNVAVLANPYVLAAAAVAGLAAAIVLWTKNIDEVSPALKEELKAIEKENEAIRKNKESYDELVDSKHDAINAGLTELSHYEDLYDELQGLVDKNGKVKEGYEGRAGFITSTLAEAYGIEIDMVDGVIQNYSDLTSSMDEVMEKKKAMIILNTQEELYADAIQNQAEALKVLNEVQNQVTEAKEKYTQTQSTIQDLDAQIEAARQQSDYNEVWRLQNLKGVQENKLEMYSQELSTAKDSLSQQEELVKGYAYNIGVYEENAKLAREGRYDEMRTDTWELVKDYQSAEDSKRVITEEGLARERTNLDTLKQLKKETGESIYDNQIAQSEKNISALEKELEQYTKTTKTGNAKQLAEWRKSLSSQVSEITGKAVEFKNAGHNQVQMYVNGQKQGEPTAIKNAATFIESINTQYENGKIGSESAGNMILNGFKLGISNQSLQYGAFNALTSFGTTSLNTLQNSLDEHSPSRASQTMGEYLIEGVNIGIQNRSGSVFSTIWNFGQSLLSRFKSSLQEKSPSKATTQMGEYLIIGLSNGIAKKEKDLTKKIITVGVNTLKSFKAANKKHDYESLGESISKSYATGINKSVKTSITSVTTLVNNTVNALIKKNKKESAQYKKAGTAVIKAYSDAIKDEAKNAISKVESVISGISKKFQEQYNEIANKRQSLNDLLTNKSLFTTDNKGNIVLDDLKQTTNSIREYGSDLQKLKKKLPSGLMDEILAMDMETGQKYANALLKMNEAELNQYIKNYKEKEKAAKSISEQFYASEVRSLETNFNKKVNDTLGKLKTQLETIGKNAAKGLVKGMNSQKSGLSDSAKTMANTIVNTLKKQLKIKSPSRVMAALAKFIPEGVSVGIDDNVKTVIRSVKNMSGKIVDASQDMLSGVQVPMLATAGAASGMNAATNTVSNVNNFTQNIYAPKQPSRIELYRQSKNLLNWEKGGR